MKTNDHSSLPLASAVVAALLSLYALYRSSLTFVAPFQYVGVAVSVVVCGVNVLSLYGPEPIGFRLGQVSGSLTPSQMCLGTMKVWMILFWLTYWEFLKVRTTFLPSTATPSKGMPFQLSAECVFSRLKV